MSTRSHNEAPITENGQGPRLSEFNHKVHYCSRCSHRIISLPVITPPSAAGPASDHDSTPITPSAAASATFVISPMLINPTTDPTEPLDPFDPPYPSVRDIPDPPSDPSNRPRRRNYDYEDEEEDESEEESCFISG